MSSNIQVNLCQKHLFLDQLTHNVTNDCSLIYQFSTWKLQAQNMCAKIVLKVKTCSELVVFMYWTCKSMNNLLTYCGLVDPRISASDKDLPVLWCIFFLLIIFQKFKFLCSKTILKVNFPRCLSANFKNFWWSFISLENPKSEY